MLGGVCDEWAAEEGGPVGQVGLVGGGFAVESLVIIDEGKPIIAGVCGGGSGGFSFSNFAGMLRCSARVVCFSFLDGFCQFTGAWAGVVVVVCCLRKSSFTARIVGPRGLLVVSANQGAVGAVVVSLLGCLTVALRGFNHSAGVVAVVPGFVALSLPLCFVVSLGGPEAQIVVVLVPTVPIPA